MLPLVYEVKDLGENVGTFSRVDGSFIKYSGLLEYCTLLKMLERVGASTYRTQKTEYRL